MILRALAVILGFLLLAACTATPVAPGTSDQDQLADQQPLAADQIVADLAQRISTAKPGPVFTAESDPNKILGRPGGYTSKASFTDTRIPADEVIGAREGAVEYGGSVEMFETEDAARKRKEYIDSFSGIQLAVEYSWVSGSVLLRVSRVLTPDQAAEYQTALTEIS